MLAIRLPAEIEGRLDALAKATGRSKSYYAREAILEHLADMEDVYLAEQRLEELRAGRSRTYPIAEVEKRLGLEDWDWRIGGKRPCHFSRPARSTKIKTERKTFKLWNPLTQQN